MNFIEVKKEMNFNDLCNMCWDGAQDTLKVIEEAGKEGELINFLYDCLCSGVEIPTDGEVNDFLWFEDDYIFGALDIDPEPRHTLEEFKNKSKTDGYYAALEYALDWLIDNLNYPACEPFESLQNWLYENCGTKAQDWTTGAVKMITKAIEEQELFFKENGEIVEE